MAITITNDFNCFESNNLSIIFKNNIDIKNSNIDKSTKIEGDFVFLFANNKLVGINVFNYQKYFHVSSGYHLIDLEIKNYLEKNFSQYINKSTFKNFYKIGKVIEKQKHESSDKLLVLKVQFESEFLQIITNVLDVQVDNNYLFALAGATTYSGLEIQESKVLNVLSQGMICSYQTLGIEKSGLVDCSKLSLNDNYNF